MNSDLGGQPGSGAKTYRKNHWMPFYIGDFLADTMHLGSAEIGVYVLLIFAYWNRRGPLPDDDRWLSNTARVSLADWLGSPNQPTDSGTLSDTHSVRTPMRSILAQFFQIADGVWRHKRIEIELAEANRLQEARKRGAATTNNAKRHAKRTLSDTHSDMLSDADSDPQCDTQSGVQSQSQSHITSTRVPGLDLPEEERLLEQLKEILPPEELNTNGGLWRTRIREKPGAMESALAEVRSQLRSRAKIGNVAAYLTDTFRQFSRPAKPKPEPKAPTALAEIEKAIANTNAEIERLRSVRGDTAAHEAQVQLLWKRHAQVKSQ